MDGFRVRVDELGRLIAELESVGDRMSKANDRLADAGETDLGHADITNAVRDFDDDWSYGIERLGKAAEKNTHRLNKAKEAYQELDEALAGQLFLGQTLGFGPDK